MQTALITAPAVLRSTARTALAAGAGHSGTETGTALAISLGVLLVLLLIGWALYALALRVDRLHRQVLGARATLEAELSHRGEAAAELAASGGLDPASAILLSRAAHEAADASGPLVDDGLDPETRPAAGGAEEPRSRSLAESDLSRVIRAVLGPEARAEIAASPLHADALARLDRACYRVVLAHRFHDTHVAEARSLRQNPVVRVLHLAGRAPMPAAFDMDDDTTAEPQEDEQ